MVSFKTKLNSTTFKNKLTKLSDLEVDRKHLCKYFSIEKTKFGNKLSVILDDYLKVFLPDRFLHYFYYKDIEAANKNTQEKVFLVFKGTKNLEGGKIFHLIEFE